MEKFTIKDHIGVFDGFFEKDFCRDIIDFFKYRSTHNYIFNRNNQSQHDQAISINHEQDFMVSKQVQEDEFNILEGARLIEFFSKIFWEKCYTLYIAQYPYCEKVEKLRMSTFKVQKTSPGQGYHIFHFENGNKLTSNRVMFFILYLNDIECGGETEFLYQSQRIQPKTGRLVIAPAQYTHPHRGNPPLDKEKFIMTSWIDYI